MSCACRQTQSIIHYGKWVIKSRDKRAWKQFLIRLNPFWWWKNKWARANFVSDNITPIVCWFKGHEPQASSDDNCYEISCSRCNRFIHFSPKTRTWKLGMKTTETKNLNKEEEEENNKYD